jgi:protein TonB
MANPADASIRNVFLDDDRTWQLAWPAAVAGACLFHAACFMFAAQDVVKAKQVPITMSIALPPAPPPPPPPPPDPPKPPKPQKVAAAAMNAPAPKEPTPVPPPPEPVPLVETPPVALAPTTGQGVAVPLGSTEGDPNVKQMPIGASNAQPKSSAVQNSVPSGEGFDPRGYRDGALKAVNKEKRYPRKAQTLGLEGQCLVKVSIDHDGKVVGDPEIIGKGTGHAVLDEECVRMAKAAKLPPVPPEVQTPYVMRVPISFRLVDAIGQ